MSNDKTSHDTVELAIFNYLNNLSHELQTVLTRALKNISKGLPNSNLLSLPTTEVFFLSTHIAKGQNQY